MTAPDPSPEQRAAIVDARVTLERAVGRYADGLAPLSDAAQAHADYAHACAAAGCRTPPPLPDWPAPDRRTQQRTRKPSP
jgi:hypothetical protein